VNCFQLRAVLKCDETTMASQDKFARRWGGGRA
jgi:hypothetical protein